MSCNSYSRSREVIVPQCCWNRTQVQKRKISATCSIYFTWKIHLKDLIYLSLCLISCNEHATGRKLHLMGGSFYHDWAQQEQPSSVSHRKKHRDTCQETTRTFTLLYRNVIYLFFDRHLSYSKSCRKLFYFKYWVHLKKYWRN